MNPVGILEKDVSVDPGNRIHVGRQAVDQDVEERFLVPEDCVRADVMGVGDVRLTVAEQEFDSVERGIQGFPESPVIVAKPPVSTRVEI